MVLLGDVLVAFVALQHVAFLALEMFLWDTRSGRKIFRTTETFAKESAALAKNQGLYNGFLAAGLGWSLIGGGATVARFFLGCVIVAGVYGGITVNRRIMLLQALPALIAFAVVWGR